MGAIKSGRHDTLVQVMDQALGFVTLESHLFSLHLDRMYLTLNDPQTGEGGKMEQCVEQMVQSLFAV